MSSAYSFEIITNEKIFYHFTNNHGDILLTSIDYSSIEECAYGIRESHKCGSSKDNYLRMIMDDQYYYMLRDNEGKELANGEKTNSLEERNKRLYECIKNIKNGTI